MKRRRSHGPADAGTAGTLRVRRALLGPLVIALTAAGGASAQARAARSTAPTAARTAAPAAITVGRSTVGPPVAAGFVGLATEYWDVEDEVGTNPADPDVPFEQVVRNLAPDGGLSFRIGGDSTDWTWWPLIGVRQPAWVRYTITPTWAAVTQKLANDLQANMIFGINLEADNPRLAAAEVAELKSQAAGSGAATYEVGNEPELYSKYPFYHANGTAVHGRPKSYTYSDITSDWNRVSAALPGVRLAGPSYSSFNALPYVNQFLDNAHRLSLLSVHSYPLKWQRCGGGVLQESMLFQPTSLQGLATQLAPWTSLARQHGVPLRVDEMNAVTCGGAPVFSGTFGPALWALNILSLYAQDGAQGVNFETKPSTAQNLIQTNDTSSGWQVQVQPEYYGLLAFSQITPPGSRLIKVPAPPAGLLAWAVSTPSHQTNVVLTNITSAATSIRLRVAGARGTATVKLLQATSGSLSATSGVTLGGQTISPTTGQLTGTPVSTTTPLARGTYDIPVPADSAAIVSFSSL